MDQMKSVVIYRDYSHTVDGIEYKYNWYLKLYNKDYEVHNVVGCDSTHQAKSIIKSWGFAGRIEWSRIHSGQCAERYF